MAPGLSKLRDLFDIGPVISMRGWPSESAAAPATLLRAEVAEKEGLGASDSATEADIGRYEYHPDIVRRSGMLPGDVP